MDSIYSVASSSSSVVYGNVAQHVKELVKNMFPKDFFTYEHISTEIAYRHIRKRLGANSKKNLSVRRKPYLVIRPMISVPDEMYLYETPLTANMDHLHNVFDKRMLLPIIQNTEEGMGLSFKLNRDKIEFQVTLTLATLNQQIDLYKSLANIAFWNRPFTKRLPMEFMIPRGIICAIANGHNMDINDEVYAAHIFLDYINKHSKYPITYKMRNSTAKDEYFMYSNQEILFTLSDLELTEGSMKNMANDAFELSFRVTAEFNLPGLFVLFGSDEMKEKVMTEYVIAEAVSDKMSFPLFTIENLFTEFELDNGFKKFKSSILGMEPNKITGNDVTDFGVLLGDGFKKVIREYYTNHVDISTIAIVQLYKNNDLLVQGTDYDIDWYKTTMTTYAPSMEDTYRMIIYVNTIKLNDVLVDYQDSTRSDKPELTKN